MLKSFKNQNDLGIYIIPALSPVELVPIKIISLAVYDRLANIRTYLTALTLLLLHYRTYPAARAPPHFPWCSYPTALTTSYPTVHITLHFTVNISYFHAALIPPHLPSSRYADTLTNCTYLVVPTFAAHRY